VIKPKCRLCGCELDKLGAIIWGYPVVEWRGIDGKKQEQCDKNHLCQKCYKEVMIFIDPEYEFPEDAPKAKS